MVVGNSRLRRQSKKRKEGTYPLTGLALKPVSGLRNRLTSSSRGTRVGIEAEVVDALEEPRVGVAAPAVFHPGEQPPPRVVVAVGVQLVRLVDVQPPFGLRLLDERRPGRREPARAAAARLILPPCLSAPGAYFRLYRHAAIPAPCPAP